MTNHVLAENFKKFRAARGLTQEQVASLLNVNAQTVSRWECAATLPDVLMLPELARLYGVTVDDFYKKHSVAYDNYAQRLTAIYEMTHDPEDYLRCVLEYQKLMKNGEMSAADKWNFASIHHFMLRDCKNKALEWYDKAVAAGQHTDSHVYDRARSMRNILLFEIGQGNEVIAQLEEVCSSPSAGPQDQTLLLQAYILSKRYEEGYAAFLRAIQNHTECWQLYINGGEICEALRLYDEAFMYWDKAGQIGTYFHDEIYCKASCYNDMGKYEKAAETLFDLADLLRQEHYDVEADMAEEEARIIKSKLN